MRYTADWYDTDARFDAIADYLGDRHPHHVLDFGALNSVMADRFVTRYGSHVTAVDDALNGGTAPNGVTYIGKRLGPAAIRKLPRQDVTLCLSVLHHQPQWRNYLDALRSISDLLFVETAHPDENLPTAAAHHKSPQICAYLQTHATPIGSSPGYDPTYSRTLWVIAP